AELEHRRVEIEHGCDPHRDGDAAVNRGRRGGAIERGNVEQKARARHDPARDRDGDGPFARPEIEGHAGRAHRAPLFASPWISGSTRRFNPVTPAARAAATTRATAS